MPAEPIVSASRAIPPESKSFIARHAVLIYFCLAFAVSWGGVLLVIAGRTGILATTAQAELLFPIVVLAMLPGPSLAGLLLTGLVYGRSGLRELLSQLLRWQVGAQWYAFALLIAPVLIGSVLGVLSLFSTDFVPGIVVTDDRASLVLLFVGVALGAGLFEELGWTGFAARGLRLRYGVLTTGILLGFVWGLWHLLAGFWGSGDDSGAVSLPLLVGQVLTYVGLFPAFRVLMVWVYDRTGSVLVAILMHASFTAGSGILRPVAMSMASSLVYLMVLAAVVWLVVAGVRKTGCAESRSASSEGCVWQGCGRATNR